MRGTIGAVAAIMFTGLAGIAWAQPAGTSPGAPVPDARIKALLQQRIDAERVPGIVAGVLDATGSRFIAAGVRTQGKAVPVDADTRFEVGSISKTFTGVLLAQLVQEGKLSLDTPVQDLAPAGIKVPQTGRPFTLRDLATHTSGLPRIAPGWRPADPANPYAVYTDAELWKGVAAATLEGEPGANNDYSNLGFLLLSHLVVQASGKASFGELANERIFKPLAMTSSGVVFSGDNFAQPHSARLQPIPAWDFPPTMGGVGAVRSTARDMLRFAAANLHAAPGSPYAMAHAVQWEARGESNVRKMGLVWQVRQAKSGKTLFWHNGGTGGSRSFIGFDVAAGTAVVILANSADDVTALGMHLLDPESSPPPEVRKTVELDNATVQKLIGEYVAADSAKPVLFLMRGPAAEPRLMARLEGGGPQMLEAESPTRFVSASGQLVLEIQPAAQAPGPVVLTATQGAERRTLTRVADKPAVTLTASQLQSLAGTYRVASGPAFVITVEGSTLMLSVGGARPFPLVAESPLDFVMRTLNARVHFTREGDAPATALAWTQLGSTAVAKRQE